MTEGKWVEMIETIYFGLRETNDFDDEKRSGTVLVLGLVHRQTLFSRGRNQCISEQTNTGFRYFQRWFCP